MSRQYKTILCERKFETGNDMKPINIDTYIAQAPKDVQPVLKELRKLIKDEAPEAQEAFSYQMPTFKLNGKNLVHFAVWPHHIGLYPTPSAIEKFNKELSSYTFAKGSIQFPIDKPLPYSLIRKIVQFRVKDTEKKVSKK